MVHTLKWRSSVGRTSVHVVWSHIVPCTSSSGSPVPLRQQAMGVPSFERTTSTIPPSLGLLNGCYKVAPYRKRCTPSDELVCFIVSTSITDPVDVDEDM